MNQSQPDGPPSFWKSPAGLSLLVAALVRCVLSTQKCQLRNCLQQKCPKSKPCAKRVKSCIRKANTPSR